MSQIAALINRLGGEPYNLSQSEIFRRTKVSQPKLSRWAAGEVPQGVDDALKLIALAKEVGVPESELPVAPASIAQAATENVAAGA